MKKKMFAVACVLMMLSTATLMAQEALTVGEVLQQITAHNLQLQAMAGEQQALQAERSAENTLGETTVEYSPFYMHGTDGLASSELIVSQEVDFPTRFAARRRVANSQSASEQLQLLTLRRDILLQAKELCIDAIAQQEQQSLLKMRLAAADVLDTMMQRRLSLGDATQLDVNRVRLDRMEVQTALAEGTAALQSTLLELKALNGGQPIARVMADSTLLAVQSLPSVENMLEVRSAQAQQDAARQAVRAEQQGWLPRLTMGYRRNTDAGMSLHGVLVGGSLPLFSQSGRLRAARLRKQAAALQTEEARRQAEAQLQTDICQAEQLSQALQAYDEPLMQQTLQLLMRAVQLRQIPITTYFTEADAIYRKLNERLILQGNYLKAIARLQKEIL